MKILVGLSGGVDSTYAALQLASCGHTVEGCVLKMHEYTETCAAQRASELLGIPLHVIDCTSAFDGAVKSNFVSEYAAGRTPNPCIICNERVKFAALADFAVKNGFDAIATGHYAQPQKIDGRYTFVPASDEKKDQSYMLYRLPQSVLSMLILPLSSVTKEQVRLALAERGFDIASKPDSQEICFLPDGGYAEFVEQRTRRFDEGDFISDDGSVLGKHRGIVHYTVGQRRGLGIALGERMFVTEINPEKNTVTLSPKMSGKREIIIRDVAYMGISQPQDGSTLRVAVKVRYGAKCEPAEAYFLPDGGVKLLFDVPVKAAPGQSAVAYGAGGELLFGGFIR